MDIVFMIGRILYGGFFLENAYNHLLGSRKQLTGYAEAKGVPAPGLAVVGSGLLLLVGGASMITGYLPLVGLSAIVLFFLGVTFKMHNFWTIDDPQARSGDRVNFMKNMALMGSALMLMLLQSWPYSL